MKKHYKKQNKCLTCGILVTDYSKHCYPHRSCRIYNVDESFFKKWTPSMAWVLGIAASDGCTSIFKAKNTSYVFSLIMKDKDIIGKVKKALNADQPIFRKEVKTGFGSGQFWGIQIYSKIIVTDLIKKGIIPRKSKTLNFPAIPKEFFFHFVRGYFDGDGCVYKPSKKKLKKWPGTRNSPIFTSGSKNFLIELQKHLRARHFPCSLYSNGDAYNLSTSPKLWQLLYKERDQWYGRRKFALVSQYLS